MHNPFETPAPSSAQSKRAPSGATGLYYQRIVELVWSLITSVFFMFFFRSALDWLGGLTITFSFGWMALATWSFVATIPMHRGAKGTDAETITLIALVLAGVAAFLSLPGLVGVHDLGASALGLDPRIHRFVSQSLHLAADLTFWIALARLAGPLPSWATPTYLGLRLVIFALGAPFFLFLPEDMTFLHDGPFAQLIEWSHLPLGLGTQAVVIWAIHRWRAGEAKAATEAGPITSDGAQRDLVFGAIWLLGGLVVTVASYSVATEAGGSYVVTTGAIVYGVVRLIRGAIRLGG